MRYKFWPTLVNLLFPFLHYCRKSPFYEFSEKIALEGIWELFLSFSSQNQPRKSTTSKRWRECWHAVAVRILAQHINTKQPSFFALTLSTLCSKIFYTKNLVSDETWSIVAGSTPPKIKLGTALHSKKTPQRDIFLRSRLCPTNI
jgi:hypothetical protein